VVEVRPILSATKSSSKKAVIGILLLMVICLEVTEKKCVKDRHPTQKVKVKVPILIVEHRGPELLPDSRQSACR